MSLTDRELQILLADQESDRVERKANASSGLDKIRKSICALANDLPGNRVDGVIFVGVNDDGSCTELAITDALLTELSHLRGDGRTQPFPVISVKKRVLNDCTVAVIEVSPSNMPPVRVNGRVWVRIGPSLRQASAEEEARLMERRHWGILTFDKQPAVPASYDDLDLELFLKQYVPNAVAPEVLDANTRSLEHQLGALRFLAPDGSPNHAAILLFGTDPLTFIPGAYIQFVRFDGLGLTDPTTSQRTLSGPLSVVLTELDTLLSLNISVATDVRSEAREIQSPDYPIVALRQLAYNAVMHRSYEATNAPIRIYWFNDRVEISSPGGPYGQVNRENFGNPGITDYRNPLLAEAMNVLGYVQRFGIGIPLARDALTENGNPDLEFDVQNSVVLATVRAKK